MPRNPDHRRQPRRPTGRQLLFLFAAVAVCTVLILSAVSALMA